MLIKFLSDYQPSLHVNKISKVISFGVGRVDIYAGPA
jgi:hypothetical protein